MSSTKKSFWNSKSSTESNNVGSDKKQVKPERRRDSFQDFEAKTKDAWDDGDDDLLKMAASVKQTSYNHRRGGGAGGHSSITNSFENNSSHQDSAEPTKNQSLQSFQNASTTSAPNTPSRLLGHRLGLSVPSQPNNDLHSSSAKCSSDKGTWTPWLDQHDASKVEKFKSLFDAANLNLDELRTLCWSGIPPRYRPMSWKLLSGYMPTINERRDIVMERKRLEYQNLVQQYYDTRLQEMHQETFRQIHIDVPRTCPLIPLFQQELVQELFERVLYIWSIRHPASGYVQGINDLITPFFVIFLTEYIDEDADVQLCNVAGLDESCRHALEADCFWCFSKLLDGIQDNYTFAQPGIQTRINSLKELVGRIDNNLHSHLERHNIEYLQFAFRWMNNLLMREMPLHCVIRLWDTYLAEPDGFASFHLYVCAAFLTRFSQELQRERDFHGLMLLLQSLPTHQWTSKEIGLILADAYRLKFMFADAPNHYRAESNIGTAAATGLSAIGTARAS